MPCRVSLLFWRRDYATILYRPRPTGKWRLCVELQTAGLACTRTYRPAETNHRRLSTGSTAARPLFADGNLTSQMATHIVSG